MQAHRRLLDSPVIPELSYLDKVNEGVHVLFNFLEAYQFVELIKIFIK